jgi:hypothetical protein
MRIRTTEPVQGTDGEIYPTGTEAEYKEGSGNPDRGRDFVMESGVVLWSLVPVQYEEIK